MARIGLTRDVPTLTAGLGLSTTVTATPTIDTNIYAAGDLLGTKLTLSDVSRQGVNSGIIHSVTLIDQAKQAAAIDVVFFSANPSGTTFTNNAALDVADADLLNCIGVVKITASDYSQFADNAVATVSGIGLQFYSSAGNDIYAALVARGTPTYAAATDLKLVVGVLQD